VKRRSVRIGIAVLMALGALGETRATGRSVITMRHAHRSNVLLQLLCLAAALQACAIVLRDVKQYWIRTSSTLSSSEIHLTIDDSFIDTYKDRATIDVMFHVDQIDLLPHPPFWDGDFHIAGRAAKVGLPMVAEIENAAFERAALDVIRAFKGTGKPLRLAGAWRIWSEHPGSLAEVQGEHVSRIEGTNPNHVFEIHPVTSVKDLSTLASFRPIVGYSPAKAEVAFKNFAGLPCQIRRDARSTTVVIDKGAINDVEFLMEVGEKPQRVVADGRFVDAAALDLKGDRLAENLRMVFVKDSPPEMTVKNLKRGDRLHVFGLPRLDLAAVDYRARHADAGPKAATLNLPYEILIAAVYDVAN
jgi:hypothetical protein